MRMTLNLLIIFKRNFYLILHSVTPPFTDINALNMVKCCERDINRLSQCCFTIAPPSATLANIKQHWINGSCLVVDLVCI